MSGRRKRSESLWSDRKEAQNEAKEFNSSNDSLKQSNSEINDVLMSDDFTIQGNENMLMDNDNIIDKHRMKTNPNFDDWESQFGQPYRARSRSRSRSPHQSRDRDRDRYQNRARDRVRSPSRGGSNQPDNDSTKKWSNNRPEYSGGSQYHRNHKSGHNNQDHRRSSNQDIKIPCKYFIMGRCNRDNCRFLHDVSKSEVHEGRLQDHNHNDFPNSNPNFDDKNKSWKDHQLKNLESGVTYNTDLNSINNQDSRFNINLNGNGSSSQLNGSANEDGKPLETSRNDIPQNISLANSLELLSGPVDSKVVNDPVKASLPVESQKSTEPVGNVEVNEKKVAEKSNLNLGKSEAEGKVDEGNMGNDEKAMRAFKNALVEFVKEILKPTWKEGKMNKEVYKTIVKKVVEKVTSTIQGVQIPRTQEKTDQYLTFSKSKITKLVEAYVGRLVKG